MRYGRQAFSVPEGLPRPGAPVEFRLEVPGHVIDSTYGDDATARGLQVYAHGDPSTTWTATSPLESTAWSTWNPGPCWMAGPKGSWSVLSVAGYRCLRPFRSPRRPSPRTVHQQLR